MYGMAVRGHELDGSSPGGAEEPDQRDVFHVSHSAAVVAAVAALSGSVSALTSVGAAGAPLPSASEVGSIHPDYCAFHLAAAA